MSGRLRNNSPLITWGSYQFPMPWGIPSIMVDKGMGYFFIPILLVRLVGNYFFFPLWQAIHERKSPVPSSHPQWIGSFPLIFVQYIWKYISLHNNCFIFLCRSSLLLFVQKLYHLLFTRPTQHLSFALNHLSWARETNCLNCYLLLLFQCYYYLSTINLLFCDEWHIGLTVFLWASTTLTKVMWCLRYYEIYTLSRLLDICHIGLFYF